MRFEALKLGSKPDDSGDDEETTSGEGEKKPSFGDDGAQMACRSLAKAFGLDPDTVDIGKATKALKAMVAACGDDSEGEDY